MNREELTEEPAGLAEIGEEPTVTLPIISNRTYDILKWVAMILLPAIGTAYFALSNIWGWPLGEQIVGTIMALDAFLGVLLGLSTAQYRSSLLAKK